MNVLLLLIPQLVVIQIKPLLDIISDENEEGPEATIQNNNLKENIIKWLFELNPKQREVLARRFGLGYEAETLEDVAEKFLTRKEFVKFKLKDYAA